MVTNDRLGLAKRAIRCYQQQRYQNRELVIVCQGNEGYRDELRRHIEASAVPDARVIAASPRLRLGALRNVSLDAARGELVCVWDDDDCSHPDRLLRQVRHLLRAGAQASFLSAHLQFFEPEGSLHWIDWRNSRNKPRYPLLPTTMIMRRDPRFRYPESGRYAHFGEDWQLMLDLHRDAEVVTPDDMGLLYLYTYHGGNTFSREHHLRMTEHSLPSSQIRARADEIRQALDHYPIPRPVTVHGADGEVFTWTD